LDETSKSWPGGGWRTFSTEADSYRAPEKEGGNVRVRTLRWYSGSALAEMRWLEKWRGWKDGEECGWRSLIYRRDGACTHFLFTHFLVVIQKPYL
jgi:hypothetical protein